MCSDHFQPEDFDRTGQIVWIRDGVISLIFDFPSNYFGQGWNYTINI